MPPPAARLAPQFGQLVACWSSLAEQAGHVLCMIAPWSAPSLWVPVGTASTIGCEAPCVVGLRATLGARPAGGAEARRHPPGGARLVQTVNPGRRERPLRTPAAEIQLVGQA